MQYISGKLLGGTDVLSRYGIREAEDETLSKLSGLQRYVVDTEEETPWPEETLSRLDVRSPSISYQEVVTEMQKDRILRNLANTIETGFPETKAELPRDCCHTGGSGRY